MRSKNIKPKYYGMSLVETIITLFIVGLILLITSSTLAALIKASAIASAKTLSRSESEYILEIMEKSIKNSQAEQILLYSSNRYLNEEGLVEDTIDGDPPTPVELGSGTTANEIHFRPVRSSEWVCIGFFNGTVGTEQEDIGYIVKSFSEGQSPDCIKNNQLVILSSDEVDIENFEIKGFTTSGRNYTFIVDLVLKPVYWIPGKQAQIKPEYIRQLIVTTEKLIY